MFSMISLTRKQWHREPPKGLIWYRQLHKQSIIIPTTLQLTKLKSNNTIETLKWNTDFKEDT